VSSHATSIAGVFWYSVFYSFASFFFCLDESRED